MARKRRTAQLEFVNNFFKENRKVVVSVLLFLAVVLLASLWLRDFFLTSSYFDCKKIEIMKPGKGGGLQARREYFELNYPVNIFAVDPVMLSEKIKESHSEFQIVVITKFLPNRIIATIKDRSPIARIRIGKTLMVDYDGIVVLPVPDTDLESFPLIIGLESQLADPRPGTKVKSRRLAKALKMLSLIAAKKEFKDYAVETIDFSYPDKANFKMSGMTIVIGDNGNEYYRKLDALAQALSNPKIDRSRVDSIDLRFTDPAVTFRPEKK